MKWGWVLLGAWLLAPAASAATGDRLFQQGVSAFKRKDFASAARYFEEARRAGLDLPTLYYNLGASLYKLGRYGEAEEAFRACARDPLWTPLANYNAGLSAYKRGQRAAAAAYFDRAWRLADSDEVRALAFTMLERTDLAASRRPRGKLTANIGYNDNVTLGSDGQTLQTSSKSDRFTEVFATATGLWGNDRRTLRWEASIYDLRYAHINENGITDIAAALSKPTKLGSWHASFGARWDYVLRDGDRFQQIASLQATGVHDRPDHGDVRLSLEVSRIEALDDNFAFLDGSRQQLDGSLGERVVGGTVRFGATLARNDRADLATSGEFFSFSPLRYGVWFAGSWPLHGYWRFEPRARYTHSRYADADRRVTGVVATREDDEKQLTLRTTYRLTPVWCVFGDYTYLDITSNFSEFSFTQRVISIGVSRPF